MKTPWEKAQKLSSMSLEFFMSCSKARVLMKKKNKYGEIMWKYLAKQISFLGLTSLLSIKDEIKAVVCGGNKKSKQQNDLGMQIKCFQAQAATRIWK